MIKHYTAIDGITKAIHKFKIIADEDHWELKVDDMTYGDMSKTFEYDNFKTAYVNMKNFIIKMQLINFEESD